MNVYDFDETILSGDSEYYFWDYIFKKHKNLKFYKLRLKFYHFLQKKLNLIEKTKAREKEYSFLKKLDNVDKDVEEFWGIYASKIKDWYKKNHREDDVVVSATPEFLLIPIMKKIGVNRLIATVMDKKTGKISGKFNNKGEKVNRFLQKFKKEDIECFYSDSLSDSPLAEISPKAYRVRGEELILWNESLNIKD